MWALRATRPRRAPPLSWVRWLEEFGDQLKPPVANKLIYGSGKLKVMVVGGPNSRTDYHIQEGEELFWQVKGDMRLDVVVRNTFREVHIPEGHAFLLPARVPHSPQRPAESVGIVFERAHHSHEMDGLRWYKSNEPGTRADEVGVDFEEYFHCTDLGSQLGPIISRFQARPPDAEPCVVAAPPVLPDEQVELGNVVRVEDWLRTQRRERGVTGAAAAEPLARGSEFTATLISSAADDVPLDEVTCESFLWQLHATSLVRLADGTSVSLQPGDMHWLPPAAASHLCVEDPGNTTLLVRNEQA